MNVFSQTQGMIGLVLSLLLLAMQIFAFVDSLRYRADAYTAAGKLTKPAWCGITGVCVLIGVLSVGNPLQLFSLLATVGAAVYLADVRPALQQVLGRGRSNQW